MNLIIIIIIISKDDVKNNAASMPMGTSANCVVVISKKGKQPCQV